MMNINLLFIQEFQLPISNPVIKFLIILLIILFAPIILNRIKIPHILGLIIAGAVIGPNGFNLMTRDSGIILSGTAGLLYIMFLAGLEIEFNEFIRNCKKSVVFGLLTFLIPMILGILSAVFILKLNILTSILLASLFASHTLIAYPIISKLGVKGNRAVNITVGGTLITDTLALVVLAIIVGLSHGEMNRIFWIKLIVSILTFGAVVMIIFPIIARFFFKHYTDGISQYIFVLVMVFLGASLAELAGIEGIIGAFLSGLSLNRLIPHSSPLMNRIEFIGNAIFIPFFLISVGMLIDYRVFISGWSTIFTAAIMTIIATLSKFIAAVTIQKIYKYNSSERDIIFGLSNAQAAATLAAVLVGYNVILGYNQDGDPERLLSENILNGTIIMILITCTIASFVAQKGARRIALNESFDDIKVDKDFNNILIPISNPANVEEMISLAFILESNINTNSITVANIIDNTSTLETQQGNARKIFELALQYSSSADRQINTCLRYDTNYTNGILNLIRERDINDLIIGIDIDKFLKHSMLGQITKDIVKNSNVTTYIYHAIQPIQTIKRHILIIPPNAEQELGFRYWMIRMWSFFNKMGTNVTIYANESTINLLYSINEAIPLKVEFKKIIKYKDLLIISREIKNDDCLIFVMSRKSSPSYDEKMEEIPYYIHSYFNQNSFVMIYPFQQYENTLDSDNIMNPSSMSAFLKIEDIVDSIINKIRKK